MRRNSTFKDAEVEAKNQVVQQAVQNQNDQQAQTANRLNMFNGKWDDIVSKIGYQ